MAHDLGSAEISHLLHCSLKQAERRTQAALWLRLLQRQMRRRWHML